MNRRVFISFGINALGQYQACIERKISGDGTVGLRLAGGKYDGTGKDLLTAELDERQVREIRQILDEAYPEDSDE